MDLEIIAEGFKLEAADREAIERRIQGLASRFGPISSAKLTVAKGRWFHDEDWTTKAEVELPSWIIRPSSGGDKLAKALDKLFIEMTALIRHVTWMRDGVPRRCRWCAGDAFIFVRHPADATESQPQPMRLVHLAPDAWRGELEALVCRGCGHVEWIIADPQTLPVGTDGIVLVTTKPDASYRDPA